MSLSFINTNFLKTAYSFLKKIKQHKHSDSQQILEPLTTIIILATIAFKPVGTKIAVSSNSIYVQPPNAIQGPMRWTYGNNREEIHFLLKPIIRAIVIYTPKENLEIQRIFQYAVKGLNILKNSYHNFSSTLCHAIELYINLIHYSFTNTNLQEKYNDIEHLTGTNLNLSQNTKININKLFVGVWSEDEIKLISNMLALADTDPKYIEPIETIIKTKKQHIQSVILDALQIF